MSSLIILKNIKNYVPEKAIEDFQKAADKANMYCILVKLKYDEQLFLSGEGTLSDVDEPTFKSLQNKEGLNYFTFNVNCSKRIHLIVLHGLLRTRIIFGQ